MYVCIYVPVCTCAYVFIYLLYVYILYRVCKYLYIYFINIYYRSTHKDDNVYIRSIYVENREVEGRYDAVDR